MQTISSKKLALIAVTTLAGFVFWLFIRSWLNSQMTFTDYSAWLKPGIVLLFLASGISLVFLLINDKRWQMAASGLVGLMYLLVFGFSNLNIIAIIVLMLFHIHAAQTIQEDLGQRTKIALWPIMTRGMWSVIIPLMIMTSFVYYANPRIQASAHTKELPPNIQKIVQFVTNVFVERQAQLSPEQKSHVQSQVAGEATRQITLLFRPYFKYLPPILAFGFFLLLQSISFIFVWISIVVAIGAFWLFKKAGIVTIKERQIMAETIEF